MRDTESAARIWPPLAGLVAAEHRLGRRMAASGRLGAFAYEFMRFGVKQGWACLFAGAICGLVIATHSNAPLSRYDVLTLAAVAIQGGLLALKPKRWSRERSDVIASRLPTIGHASGYARCAPSIPNALRNRGRRRGAFEKVS